MFARLRQVLGQLPTEIPPLDAVLGVSNPTLSALFGAAYRGDVPQDEVSPVAATAAQDAAAAGDPRPLLIELWGLYAQWERWCAGQSPHGGNGRLLLALTVSTNSVFYAATVRSGTALAFTFVFTDEQLIRALAIGEQLAPVAVNDFSARIWIGALAREAATRPDPCIHRLLIAMFGGFFTVGRHDHDRALALVEELLPLSGLARDDLPEIRAADARTAALDSERDRMLAGLGAPLAAAMVAVLDAEQPAIAFTLADAVQHPALRALADLSPEERGDAFHRMLAFLSRDLTRCGEAGWHEVQKRGGRYHTAKVKPTMPYEIGNILGVLATRKMVLTDADSDVAMLVELLEYFPSLAYKKVVDLLLGTVRAHPHGRAAAALRTAFPPSVTTHTLIQFRIIIEETLRDLPPATGQGPGSEGPATGSGATDTLAPPEIVPDRWTASDALGQHYNNLFDPRLYDAAHLDLLARLARLATDLDAAARESSAARIAFVGDTAAFAQRGFRLQGDMDRYRQVDSVADTAAMGADLYPRFTAMQPFVTARPDMARALSRLAGELGGKPQPTAKWLAQGKGALATVPAATRLAMLAALTAAASPPGHCGFNIDQIRTVILLSADLDAAAVGPLLTDYALKQCYVTLPGIGIRNEKIGNSCIWTLAALPAGAGVPFLARILARTRYPKIKAKIDARLNEAATAAGIDRATLDELTVPTHELDVDGCRVVPVGDGTATIRIADGNMVAIDWAGAGGKRLKAPSVAMKADGDTLKAVKGAAKELEADLAVQPHRLQRLYLQDRGWPAQTWRARYLDHPLLGTLARRLIWWVERDGRRVAAMPERDTLRDVAGQPVALDDATLRLWHPIEADVGEIAAWRDRLEAGALVQPFAQAWREVYALTDAERATGTYSNRWAAHILKQHQAMTLARLNGWRVTHRMWVDAPNDAPWHLTIPAHGLVADYWVEGAGGDDPEVTDSNAHVYVTTDRVQFHEAAGDDSAHGPTRGRAVPLTDVPPIVFSEVMRQADLLTAVASIAADPAWLDRGGDAAHPTQWGAQAAIYWRTANTAELAESGMRRREMLERIVPRLAIAPKLTLEARYLAVEGSRHRYRIHLGSGACFRGERHICIVPAATPRESRVWLPFEGDRTLSIILSKAVLLAADATITDPVILAQL